MVQPYSKESEMMVLGSMLMSVNSLNIGCDLLEEENFFLSENRIVFLVLKKLYAEDRQVDLHLVAEELKRLDKLEYIGGAAYLVTLAQYAGTSVNIEEYCQIVIDKSTLRRMINSCLVIKDKAMQPVEEVSKLLGEAQQSFYQIGQKANDNKAKMFGDILSGMQSDTKQAFLQEVKDRQERYRLMGPSANVITGLSTGLIDLDKMINGLGRSNLIILGARPSMGKTALALNIAENICFRSNKAVGIFSLEMSADQLVHRVMCSQSGILSDKILRGTLTQAEYQRLEESVASLQGAPLIVDDSSSLKISDLRARARRMKEGYGIELLVIDYLQLITGASKAETRQQEISEISRMLKALARELNIPVLCLSQLSRKVEERPGHRPQMSDIRESGSIEQDADVIMLLLRREYYDKVDKPGIAEVIIGKNRHGEVGSVTLAYRKEIAQFNNLTYVQI